MTVKPATALNTLAEIPLCGHVSQMAGDEIYGIDGNVHISKGPERESSNVHLWLEPIRVDDCQYPIYIGRIETAGRMVGGLLT